MCDYRSNYRACRPQLVHSFSFISFLINGALVITGFVRGGFNALTVQHRGLLNTSPSFRTAQPFFIFGTATTSEPYQHHLALSSLPCGMLSPAPTLTQCDLVQVHCGSIMKRKEKRYRNRLRERRERKSWWQEQGRGDDQRGQQCNVLITLVKAIISKENTCWQGKWGQHQRLLLRLNWTSSG